MDLTELKQQQAELRSEILERLLFLHHPDLAPLRQLAPDDPGRAPLTELERGLEEKRAQLRELDARIERASSFSFRFHAESFRMRGFIWFTAAAVCLTAFFIGAVDRGGGLSALMGLAALCALAWALWASVPPSV